MKVKAKKTIRTRLIQISIWVIFASLLMGCKIVISDPFQRTIPGFPRTFWSSDSNYLSHSMESDVVIIEVAHSGPNFPPGELLTSDHFGYYARWSPDATKLAFITADGDGDVIKTYNIASEEIAILTGELIRNGFSAWFQGDLDIRELNWAPDNQRLAFSVKRSETQDIYIVNSDGTQARKVIEDGTEPVWSPDGKTLAFVRNDDIYLFHVDNEEEVQLTFSSKIELAPLWSPDGELIVYTVFQNYSYEIYLMNADGSNQVNISNHPATDFWASWSPDGQVIMFTSTRDDQSGRNNGEIYFYYLEENELRRLTNTPTQDEFEPIWSPDGERIAFWSHSTSRLEKSLYMMDIDSGERIFVQSIDYR